MTTEVAERARTERRSSIRDRRRSGSMEHSSSGWSLGSLALAAVGVMLGIWLYPEARRYMKIRQM